MRSEEREEKQRKAELDEMRPGTGSRREARDEGVTRMCGDGL